ncbi:hypothetical protein [Burkholderia diffusa]|uniref:hypothetical protein n=1 Tax=Burkholderia diffusa TaxID=488732 RepID=UPI0012D8F595|nr:hypothetical protein [Burkholderia diffusa]
METIDAIAVSIQINRMAPFIIDDLDIQKKSTAFSIDSRAFIERSAANPFV